MPAKKWIFWLKVLALVLVIGFVGYKLYDYWQQISLSELHDALTIDWRWGGVSIAGFMGVMLTSALGWVFIARRMGDKVPVLPLLGAYCFSQMGKYVPGKVMLLVMRVERSSRLGMPQRICTLSTLLENVAYMISGAIFGGAILAKILAGRGDFQGGLLLTAVGLSCVALLVVAHPKIFYRLVNPVLRKMKRPEVEPSQRLRMRWLLLSIILMVPCWVCGGVALWATTRCLVPIELIHVWGLMGAFALSVIGGMVSFLPGGLGPREAVQALFLLPVVMTALPAGNDSQAKAAIIVTVVVILQRLFQIVIELLLGLAGGLFCTITARRMAQGTVVAAATNPVPVAKV